MLDPVNDCQPAQRAATCRRSDTGSKNILVYLQHDSRNERFEDMINGTFKYPEIRFFGYLPKRIPEPSETRFSDNSVTYGFNDFMTQCRQSPFVRRTASPQNRIRDDPPACVVTEADGATAKSVWKQKNKSSTIKINGTMSKEIFVAFATQKGGIGKSTVTALAASYLHNVKGY